MSTIRKKVANALSFAHLTGFAKASDTDDEKDRRDDAEQDDPEKKDQDQENGNSKKGKRAEDDDDDDTAEDDKPDDKEKDSAKGSRADNQDADEDEDDEDEMRGKSAAASARRRERARCAAIFGSKAAGRNPQLAANLAFNTSMTRKEALAVLENTPGSAVVGQGRSARNPSIAGGGDRQMSSAQATKSNWDNAFQRVSGRRK